MTTGRRKQNSPPTIGILTVSDNKDFFRGNYPNFIDLIQIGQNLGAIVYVVTTDDLHLTNKKIRGFCYDSEKKIWTKEWMPRPTIIYNRIPNRTYEMLPQVRQKILSCMQNNRVKLFNPSFFNKWTLYEWLSDSPATKKYIPATFQLSSPEELEIILRRYPILYLKPIRGKAGKGIMRIDRKSINLKPIYRLTYQDQRRTRQSLHTSTQTLWMKIENYKKTEDYIMQQGIDIVKHNERPYDLRVLIQKTGRGRWKVTGVGARLAGDTSITTHVPRGGSIEDPEKLLIQSFGPSRGVQLLKQTKRAALFLARHIERKSGHTLGEMSMDLGIDTAGNAWFFEANSKPMKFDEPHIRDQSLKRIIRYCFYLNKNKRVSRK